MKKGIGLGNIRFRLDNMWGGRAGLTVKRENGTVITVTIPIE